MRGKANPQPECLLYEDKVPALPCWKWSTVTNPSPHIWLADCNVPRTEIDGQPTIVLSDLQTKSSNIILLPSVFNNTWFHSYTDTSWRHLANLWYIMLGFPVGSVLKNLPANAGDAVVAGSIPGLGRSAEVENGAPFQYSCLENSTDRGAGGLQSMGSRRVRCDWAHTKSLHGSRFVPDPLKLTMFWVW